MKKVVSILILFSSLGFLGCGTDDAQTASDGKAARVSSEEKGKGAQAETSEKENQVTILSNVPRGRFGTITRSPSGAQPRIHPSDKPPPKRIMIRDIKLGSGPVARVGDEVSIYYYSVDYKTRERQFFRWPPQEALTTRLSSSEPWHLAVAGMRAGGSREMVIPPPYFVSSSTLDYFVEMVRVDARDSQQQSQ